MAETGYNWGSWAFVQKSSTNWDDDALGDNGIETSDPISLDGKAACIVSIQAYEDNTGAIDGVVTVAILGDTDATNYEDPPAVGSQVGSPYKFEFTPTQNDTTFIVFNVDPKYYDSFKISIMNESGQELAMDVRYKTATIPPAS